MGFYKKILLLGKDGQVGWELQRALAPLGILTALNRSECDLRDLPKLSTIIETVEPDLIVNAAGYTNVDAAETDPEAAFAINSTLPKFLAVVANVRDIPLVHFSTDYVFDGAKDKPYQEMDRINPLSVYGKSKAAGEENIRAIADKYLIIRTSWVYGRHGDNFPKKIIELAQSRPELNVVNDQVGVPTPASFLVDTVIQLLKIGAKNQQADIWGVYQVVPDGRTSWFEYATFILNVANELGVVLRLSVKDVQPVSSEFFSSPAKRPNCSVLSNEKVKRILGCTIPTWELLARKEIIGICESIKEGDNE